MVDLRQLGFGLPPGDPCFQLCRLLFAPGVEHGPAFVLQGLEPVAEPRLLELEVETLELHGGLGEALLAGLRLGPQGLGPFELAAELELFGGEHLVAQLELEREPFCEHPPFELVGFARQLGFAFDRGSPLAVQLGLEALAGRRELPCFAFEMRGLGLALEPLALVRQPAALGLELAELALELHLATLEIQRLLAQAAPLPPRAPEARLVLRRCARRGSGSRPAGRPRPPLPGGGARERGGGGIVSRGSW